MSEESGSLETITSRRISIKEKLAPPSKFGLEDGLEHMGVSADFLSKKRIVNMGAGGDDWGKELRAKNVEAQVVNIDLNYPRKFMGVAEMSTPQTAVRADILRLPLADESMDTVVSGRVLSRWVPKGEQLDGFVEGLRVLKPGGEMFVWPFSGLESADPKKIIKRLGELYPGMEMSFDKRKSLLRLRKPETKPIDQRGCEEILERIKDEKLRTYVANMMKDCTGNRDVVDMNEYKWRDYRSFLLATNSELSYKTEARKAFGFTERDEDWQTAREYIGRCIDVGDLVANNSLLAYAQARTPIMELVIGGKAVTRDEVMLQRVLDFDSRQASLGSKLEALDEAMWQKSWANENKILLEGLRESDPEGWWLAVWILKKNMFQMSQREKDRVAAYFSKLVEDEKGNKEKLEVFRVLGYRFTSDPVVSEFTNMHDISVWRTAEYWGSTKGRMFPSWNEIGNYRDQEKTWAGRALVINEDSNVEPVEYAKQIIKLMKSDQNKFKFMRMLRLIKCPGCYGYASGWRGQLAAEQFTGVHDSQGMGREADLQFAMDLSE